MLWYVMHSKPQKEELLYEQLIVREIDAYYPCIKVHPVNPRARRKKPYFPGYLFIKADLDAIGPSILRWMPGAIGLVDYGGVLAEVPDELIQEIRHKVDGVNAVAGEGYHKFRSGDIVTIQSGPFTGYSAIFDSHLPGHERVRVLMQMLRDRQVGVELSASQIAFQEQH